LNIDIKISPLPIWRYIGYCSRSVESDVFFDAISVNSNKVVFSADDCFLIKLMKQQKV